MEGFQKTILVLVVLVLSAQLAHFTYVKFLQPTQSVLDDELDESIKGATSLEEIYKEFELSEAEVQEFEDSLSRGEKLSSFRKDIEPFKSNQRLRAAIRDWERKQAQIKRLIFQWSVGMLLALAGMGLYLKRITWIGTALIAAGLAEMIWWCSPSIALGGSVQEFEKILNIKIMLTLATAGVFAANWAAWRKLDNEGDNKS